MGGRTPTRLKSSAWRSGHSTDSISRFLTSSRPPTSPQPTSGTSTKTSRIADGSTSHRAALKSAMPISRDRRVSYGICPEAKSIAGKSRRRQSMAASRQRASRSAPTKPWVMAARWARSTSAVRGIPRLWISRISLRPSRSGIEMAISRSNRPGRRSAGSRAFGRLVAARTITLRRRSSPSIRASNCATTRFSTSPTTRSRGGAIASISSMKMMLGACWRRLLEDLAEVGLALAVELVDDLGAVDREELGVGLVGHGAGDQGLSASRGPVEQDALGRIDPQPLEDFRIAERQLDDLADAVQLALEAADILVSERASRFLIPITARFALGRPDDLQFGGRVHHDRSGRRGGDHLEIGRAVAEELGPNPVAGQHGQAVEEAADVLEIAIAGLDPHGFQHNPLRRTHIGPGDLDQLIDRRAGILAGHAVDLHARPASILLEGRHHLDDRGSLARDGHHVSDADPQPGHVDRVKPRQPPSQVLGHGLRNLQLHRRGFRRCHPIISSRIFD